MIVCYCGFCHKPIVKNVLIIVSDGYDLYWVFDSAECCRQFFVKYGYEMGGFYSSSSVEELANQVRKRPRWALARYTVLQIKQLIEKGKI